MGKSQLWRALGVFAAAGIFVIAGCGVAVDGEAQASDGVGSGETTGMTSPETAPSSESPGETSPRPSTTESTGQSTAETATDTMATVPTAVGAGGDETTTPLPPMTVSESTVGTRPGQGDIECIVSSDWGLAEQRAELSVNAPIREVSAETDDCVDRFVIEVGPNADAPGYLVQYVSQITEDGSGFEVPITGNGKLQVIIDSPAYDPDTGRGTLQIPDHSNVVDVSSLRVIQQVAFAGSFEGQSTFGIGVNRQLPFHVTTTVNDDGSAVLTIEIAHAG